MSQLSLAQAVARYAPDGARVYLGNFGAQLFCVGHELIRQERLELDVVIASGGLLLDQLFGAGVVRTATFGHCWSPVGPAPAWNFRRLAESGAAGGRLHELPLGWLTAGLAAGAQQLPFMPVPDLPGTGYVTEDWTGGRTQVIQTSFGSARVVSAEIPDVAFVHADLADADGNATIRGPLGETVLAAQAARATVVVAEEVVPTPDVLAAGVTLPALVVNAVVACPGAVRPDGAVGRYDRDVTAYRRYSAASRTVAGFRQWLSAEVLRLPEAP